MCLLYPVCFIKEVGAVDFLYLPRVLTTPAMQRHVLSFTVSVDLNLAESSLLLRCFVAPSGYPATYPIHFLNCTSITRMCDVLSSLRSEIDGTFHFKSAIRILDAVCFVTSRYYYRITSPFDLELSFDQHLDDAKSTPFRSIFFTRLCSRSCYGSKLPQRSEFFLYYAIPSPAGARTLKR